MIRRAFLQILGLSPVIAPAAVAEVAKVAVSNEPVFSPLTAAPQGDSYEPRCEKDSFASKLLHAAWQNERANSSIDVHDYFDHMKSWSAHFKRYVREQELEQRRRLFDEFFELQNAVDKNPIEALPRVYAFIKKLRLPKNWDRRVVNNESH